MSDQSEFVAAVLDPQKPVPDGIVGPDGKPTQKRFNVYRNNVIVSLIEALQAAYPAIAAALGTEQFRAMAGHYVRLYPPKTPLMILYGEDLPRYLTDHPPPPAFNYLADLARLERARLEAHHGADATPCPATALSDVPADLLDQARLHLHPSMRIIRAPHPVRSLWHHFTGDGARPQTHQAEDVLISRPFAQVQMHLLPLGAAAFLLSLASGAPLGQAAEAGAADHPEFDLTQAIGGMLVAEILTGVIAPKGKTT